jgi:hypothetical protein
LVDRIGQNAIQARAVGGIRETSAAASIPSVGVKFHPGHWVSMQYPIQGIHTLTTQLFNSSDPTVPKTIKGRMEEMGPLDNVMGMFLPIYLGAAEQTKGDYSPAFSLIDQALSICASLNKQLGVSIYKAVTSDGTTAYQTSPDVKRFAPYTVTEGLLAQNTGEDYVSMKLWEQAPMDRYIAALVAILNRYDSHPNFEFVSTGETSTKTDFPTYSSAAALVQWKRLITALAAVAPHTQKIIQFNSAFSSQSNQIDFARHLVANKMTWGDADVRPDYFPPPLSIGNSNYGTIAQRIYQGLTGGIDYRGVICAAYEIQGPNLGGNHMGTRNPAALAKSAVLDTHQRIMVNQLQNQYAIWSYKDFDYNYNTPTNDVRWKPEIKAHLQRPIEQIRLSQTIPSVWGVSGVDMS